MESSREYKQRACAYNAHITACDASSDMWIYHIGYIVLLRVAPTRVNTSTQVVCQDEKQRVSEAATF